MKRILLLLLCLSPFLALAKSFKVDDYEYIDIGNGNCKIIKYLSKSPLVVIPSSINDLNITVIGSNCFANSKILREITIPNGIVSLEKSCFKNCQTLERINLTMGLISIGDECFMACSLLNNVKLPNSITALGQSCFQGCGSLENITIPNSKTSLSPILPIVNH